MPVIKVICVYCGVGMGYKHCAEEQDGKVSHGCCVRCSNTEMEKLDQWIKEQNENPSLD